MTRVPKPKGAALERHFSLVLLKSDNRQQSRHPRRRPGGRGAAAGGAGAAAGGGGAAAAAAGRSHWVCRSAHRERKVSHLFPARDGTRFPSKREEPPSIPLKKRGNHRKAPARPAAACGAINPDQDHTEQSMSTRLASGCGERARPPAGWPG